MNKRSFFWKPFASERVNESPKLVKSAEKYFYPFSSFWANLSSKKSFVVRSETLGLLLNKLTANSEYSGNQFKCNYLKKPKTLCQFFIVFFESRLYFEHLK